MAETVQNLPKMQDTTQPAFLFGKNHQSQYNILINLKTSNYSIFMGANYRADNRDSPLSTPKDCSHLSKKKLGTTKLGMCCLGLHYLLLKLAVPLFISSLPPLTTPISFLLSSGDRARALFCIRGMAGKAPL